jgi:hypothetical protein
VLEAYRFTLQMPEWCTTCTTGRVEPDVNGSSTASAPVENRSVIAVGKMHSPSPVAVTSE